MPCPCGDECHGFGACAGPASGCYCVQCRCERCNYEMADFLKALRGPTRN